MYESLPFTEPASIADTYRPGRSGPAASALETLRRKDLLSDGLDATLRSSDGRLRGKLRLYCALQLDAARCARRGDLTLALYFTKESAKLEQSAAALTIQHWFESFRAERSHGGSAFLAEAFAKMSQTSTTRDALSKLSSRIQLARAKAPSMAQTMFGRVIACDADDSTIELDDGELLRIETATLSERGLARLGAPIALRREKLSSGQMFFEFEPAIEIESPDDDDADGLLAPPTRRSASALASRYAALMPSSSRSAPLARSENSRIPS